MTNEEQVTESQETSDLLSKIRDEMAEQIATMKSAFESQLKELGDKNIALSKENEDLQRALVRTATVPAPQFEQEKTEEEIYSEHVERCTKHVLDLIK